MELQGKLIERGNLENGTSKNGKDWVRQNVIIETDGTYPKKICIQLTNNELIEGVNKVTIGSNILFFVNIESNEYNGKWFTNIKAWKYESK
jgi:hypothetical protein